MKTLKFADPLIALVLESKKDTTWRINDDKDLKPLDILSLQSRTGREFAQAQILWVKETTFGNLTKEDREGHEPFTNTHEMLVTYRSYYGISVTEETILKVVKFKLIS